MNFEWNEEKNIILKEARNITFEDIVLAIQNDKVLDFIESPTHENQSCLVVDFNGYAYIVPFVQKDENTIFLKTIYPSRKHAKFYNLKD